ncbi:MAG: dCMP deaminase [OCS116 cluster bacterium]|nr:dCMP deaminase [OCS116 cluster bacterium]
MDGSEKTQKWNRRFRVLCNHIASWSEDPHFKVGAVIVGFSNEIISTGYNGFPRGVDAGQEVRFNRESGEKFFWMEHAERNAIYNAARNGVRLQDCKIYINRFPCADCARAIIQTGITKISCPPKPKNDGALDHSFSVAEIMIGEASLDLCIIELNE